MNEKTAIRSILKNYLKVSFKLRLKEQDRNLMNKKLFIETLTLLREIVSLIESKTLWWVLIRDLLFFFVEESACWMLCLILA
jgi:hypothetical protein